MDDTTTTNEVDARRVDQTGRQDMHVVCHTIGMYGMASVVTTLSTTAKLRIGTENIGQFAFGGPSERARINPESEVLS